MFSDIGGYLFSTEFLSVIAGILTSVLTALVSALLGTPIQ